MPLAGPVVKKISRITQGSWFFVGDLRCAHRLPIHLVFARGMDCTADGKLGSAHMPTTAQPMREFVHLSPDEQTLYIAAAQNLIRRAQPCAIPIIIAPPPSLGGEVNGATCCTIRLSSGCFIVTASHVLEGYERRLQKEPRLNWQVGGLPPFDPLPRIAWRSVPRDIVFLRVSEDEAVHACGAKGCIIPAATGWPPQRPNMGDPILVLGYPKTLREVDQSWIGGGPYSAILRVTAAGDDYVYSQIEHKDLMSFDGGPLPAPSTDLGGLSGGPVVLIAKVASFVGLVSQHHQSYDLLRIATLNGTDEREFRQVPFARPPVTAP
jgi:hypothetical protein